MIYNDVKVLFNQNYYLTNHFTKGKIMQLGLKKYEIDYLYREGFMYVDLILLMYKFRDEHLFCDFVRKNLIKNSWW